MEGSGTEADPNDVRLRNIISFLRMRSGNGGWLMASARADDNEL
jgi:hypothetical protein